MKDRSKKRIYKVLVIAHKIERRAILLAATLIVALVIFYIYFVASAIVSAVAYREARVQIANMNSKTAVLETAYITSKDSITNDLAITMGFDALTTKTYLRRTVRVGLVPLTGGE